MIKVAKKMKNKLINYYIVFAAHLMIISNKRLKIYKENLYV